jgi:site-specific recombinase XerD
MREHRRAVLSYQARHEVLERMAPRYHAASSAHKTLLLDSIVELTGYARKYAITLLKQMPANKHTIVRPHLPIYGSEVQHALFLAWQTTHYICAQRLVPFLPSLVVSLEHAGRLSLTEEHRRQLLAMSTKTAERFLHTQRKPTPHGLSTTQAGLLLKHQIPIRTFSAWDEIQPSFLEADLVAHCSGHTEGGYLYTFTLTDIATGWTECLPLLNRSPETVLTVLKRARVLFPFPIRGLDTDNGGEFINEVLVAYCAQEQITFTRGRPEQHHDNCFVEQKNRAIVRHIIGYDRLVGEQAYQQLAELYRALRLHSNCFQPSMKLQSKRQEGEKVRRVYDVAKTPLQRVLFSGVLPEPRRQELSDAAQTIDPLALMQQVEHLQRALFRCVGHAPRTPLVRFSLEAWNDASFLVSVAEVVPDHLPLRQNKPGQADALDWSRSTRDPFAGEWERILAFVSAHPQCSGGAILQELERFFPGRYQRYQLSTLALGLRKIRKALLEARAESWPTEVIQGGEPVRLLPPPQTTETVPQADASLVPAHASVAPPPQETADGSCLLRQPPTEEEATLPPEPTMETPTSPLPLSGSVQDQKPLPSSASPNLQEASSHPTSPITVDQAILLYLQDHAAQGGEPKTVEWHQTALKQLQQYLSRRHICLLSSLTETEIRGWLAFLHVDPSATGILRTVSTIATYARSVRAFCHWAIRQGYLAHPLFSRGMVPKTFPQQLHLVEPETFDQVLHACRAPGNKGDLVDHATARNRALLWVLLETGLLVSEVCKLQIKDLDRHRHLLRVPGKGPRERQISLGQKAQRALETYLDPYRMRVGKRSADDLLFLSEQLQPLTPNAITQLFHRLSMRAGITGKPIRPSMLRDTFAIHFLQEGGDLVPCRICSASTIPSR